MVAAQHRRFSIAPILLSFVTLSALVVSALMGRRMLRPTRR